MVKLHPRAGGETGRRSRLKIYLPRGNKSSILFPPMFKYQVCGWAIQPLASLLKPAFSLTFVSNSGYTKCPGRPPQFTSE